MSEVPFKEMEYDGIMGLGMMQLALSNQYSYLEKVKDWTLLNVFYIDKENSELVFEQMEEDRGLKVPLV